MHNMSDIPEITKFEAQVQMHGGQTFRSNLSNMSPAARRKPAAKLNATENESQLELVREIGRLRQEIAHYKTSMQAMVLFWEKTRQAFFALQQGLQEVSTSIQLTEQRALADWGINLEEAGDITVV